MKPINQTQLNNVKTEYGIKSDLWSPSERIMKYGGIFILVTTVTEKKFYTQEDLLVAMSKLPEKEARNILENMKISTILEFINTSSEAQREQLKNNFSEAIHKELDVYNAFNRLYDMLPVIEHKYYEKMEQENKNVCSESACEEKKDVVE